MVSRLIKPAVLTLLLLFGAWQFGHAAYIHSKAALAQVLIMRAWQQALASPSSAEATIRPWRWADTWPVARLRWQGERERIDLIVLMGTNGESLAFGPGQMFGTDEPGKGATVLAGHRDTHFRFLQHVQVGDSVELQTRNGQWHNYRVREGKVVDARDSRVTPQGQELWLVTCYPFNAMRPGGPLRYVVRLQLV